MDGTLHIILTGFVAPMKNKMSNTLDTNKGDRCENKKTNANLSRASGSAWVGA